MTTDALRFPAPACILRRGTRFVRLQAETARRARVLGGNVFREGDRVELPGGRTWRQARAADRRGNTAVSPLELALAYDGASQSWLLAPRPPGEGAPGPAEPDPDETAQLAREVAALFEGDEPGMPAFASRPGFGWNATCA
jgi:hypothetical protein